MGSKFSGMDAQGGFSTPTMGSFITKGADFCVAHFSYRYKNHMRGTKKESGDFATHLCPRKLPVDDNR